PNIMESEMEVAGGPASSGDNGCIEGTSGAELQASHDNKLPNCSRHVEREPRTMNDEKIDRLLSEPTCESYKNSRSKVESRYSADTNRRRRVLTTAQLEAFSP